MLLLPGLDLRLAQQLFGHEHHAIVGLVPCDGERADGPLRDDWLRTTFDGLRAGALGYLLKDAPSEKLSEAIRVAARGESFLQPSVAAKVVAEFARLTNKGNLLLRSLIEPLSGREQEILVLIATGASNREIANKLFLAEGTVKNHVTSVLAKLGVRDRTQAAPRAREMGLI